MELRCIPSGKLVGSSAELCRAGGPCSALAIMYSWPQGCFTTIYCFAGTCKHSLTLYLLVAPASAAWMLAKALPGIQVAGHFTDISQSY